MNEAFNIIVIILSLALAVFLTVAIVAVVFVVKLVKQLRAIAASGQHIASQAEDLTTSVVQSVSTGSLIRSVTGLVSAIRKFKK